MKALENEDVITDALLDYKTFYGDKTMFEKNGIASKMLLWNKSLLRRSGTMNGDTVRTHCTLGIGEN